MSVLFGAHGMAATLTADAARGLMERMGARAAVAAIPLPSAPVTTIVTTDGVAFGVCERQHPGETLPLPTARGPGLWLAIQGRLDNRAELAALLNLPALDDPDATTESDTSTPDAALVLAAYQRFGIDCVEHLLGDWVFALWDVGRNRLLLARDATGNSAAFWWQGGGQLLFATSLPTLLAAGPVPTRPNARWIAGLLTVFTDPAYPGATAFEGVFAIPPGHVLLVEGGQADLKRWWHPEALQPIKDTPLPELEARFLALYEDAVRRSLWRRRGAVAATLSGGLDSGSVVALAAPMLAQQGQRLTGYVHTPRFSVADGQVGRTQDEWPLAQATARFVGNVDAVACPTDHISPIEGIQRWLDVTAAPSFSPSNWYWLLDIVQRAASAGASVLLTGQGGNYTVSNAGTGDLHPMLRRSGLAAVLQELGADEAGWLGALRDRVIKPALRPVWHAGRRILGSAMSGTPGWHAVALPRTALADHFELAAAMSRAGHDPGFRTSSPQQWRLLRLGLLGGADNGLALWNELATAHSLSIRDPTRDRRIVEFCWRLPDQIFWAHGRKRGLVRCGMHDRLPPEVLDCTSKGLQSSDIRLRLRECRDDFLGRIDEVCRHPIAGEWIDTERLVGSAQWALDGEGRMPADSVAIVPMLRALAAGMFIARHT